MASVPSSSARAAVIRCRGNIFGRKQAKKTSSNSGLKYGSAPDTGRGWADIWQWIQFGLNTKQRNSLKTGLLGVLKWKTDPRKQQQQGPGQTSRFNLHVSPPRESGPRTAGGLAAAHNAALAGETERCRMWKLPGYFQSVLGLASRTNKGKRLPSNPTQVGRWTAWSNASKINTRNVDLYSHNDGSAATHAILRISGFLLPTKWSHRAAVLCWPSGWSSFGRGCFCCTDALSKAFQRTFGTVFQCHKPGELSSSKPLPSSGVGAAGINVDLSMKSAICNGDLRKELDNIAERATRAKEMIQETSRQWEGSGSSDGMARVSAEVEQTERQFEALLRRTDPAQSEEARRALEPRIEALRKQRERLQASVRD
ncbi:hypothetical protein AOXY_G27739 [Acipenser oxyrinchus oxyrinchus]|uniref:Uncharacterized protein n=1 Tax=Acipenser oxyrinchus oxyrinchus TaxID=40147 RepID=A0AAD8CS66_ACIOX|nr:hypothetical protein AOXY_G27739 [Acipenser oxyrinchus oxyrinchus]